MSMKFNVLLGVLCAALLVVLGFFGYRWFDTRQQELAQVATFVDAVQSWSPESPAADSMRSLKKLRADYARFEKDGISEAARQRYDELVAQLQAAVEADYGKTWDALVIKDVEGVEDPQALSAAVTKLEDFIRQVGDDEKALAKPTVTSKYRTLASEHAAQCQARIEAIAEAKRKAEEEAKRKAEEEARIKAEEEARKKAEEAAAQTIYETDYFTVDLDDSLAGRWSVRVKDWTAGTYGRGTTWTLHLDDETLGMAIINVCGPVDMENPSMMFMGKPSAECRLFKGPSHEYPGDLNSMATVTMK